MPWDAHHRNGKMAAVTHHCQYMRSRSLSHGVVARYSIRSKQHLDCSLRGGVGRSTPRLSDARRFSRAQHAYMRLPTDSTARCASTRRPRHACSISTHQPTRVPLAARTAVSDLAARLGAHHNDVESSNLDGYSDAALWWRFSKAPPRPNPRTSPPRGAMGGWTRCETWRDYWSVVGARGAGFALQNARGAVLSHDLHAIVRTESQSRRATGGTRARGGRPGPRRP